MANIVLKIPLFQSFSEYQMKKRSLFKSGGSSVTVCVVVRKQINLPT